MEHKDLDHSMWVAGDYSLWLVDIPSNGRPVNINLRMAEFTGFKFSGGEWGELFYKVLGCPPSDKYVANENIKDWLKRNEIKFREAVSKFPMLGELYSIHSKIIFDREQTTKLREEILKIMPVANDNKLALQGLMKLNEASEKAIEKEKLLFLNG